MGANVDSPKDKKKIVKTSVNTRELVLEMLLEITAEKQYSHLVVRNVLDKYNYLQIEEKAFIKRICEGTLERMIQIDYVIDAFSKIKTTKMKPVIRNILRMSVYQILFMNAVPDSAACNEAVKLAEKKKFHQLKGFVNGVLRTISRQKNVIKYPEKGNNIGQYLSIQYSMPEWIVKKWLQEYEEQTVEQILLGLLKEHPVTVRIEENLKEQEKNELLSKIKETGITLQPHPYLSYAYLVEHMEGTSNLPGFQEGMVTIQDVSSMLVSEIAGIRKGDFVLDVCASPGGKALHAACKLNGTGYVEARDLTDYKVSLIRQNINRMQYTNIGVTEADALVFQKEKVQTADVVFADLPCSGLGVIGKKRDIKYRILESSLSQIAALQKSILDTVQNYVKPGGTLIYSTCTINRMENEEMVNWFVRNYPFELESLNPQLPKRLQNDTTAKGYLQLLPGIHETDGFFIAKMKKREA